MQKFQSFKRVEAGKISGLQTVPGGAILHLGGEVGGEQVSVDEAWLAKHGGPNHDLVGGYVVVYADGYKSWSPADAFELGNVPIHEEHTSGQIATLAAKGLRAPLELTPLEIQAIAGSALTQTPDRAGEAQGLPVAGYKPTQPGWAIEAVNGFKALEERTLRAIDSLGEGGEKIDARFLAIGRTQIQQGFMAVNRAVFQPQRVTLPEDSDGPLFASDAKGG